jgi:hypothetical protein
MVEIQSTSYSCTVPVNEKGEYIRIILSSCVMRMFEILDYKWKTDPVTGQERWLEVIRAMGPLMNPSSTSSVTKPFI